MSLICLTYSGMSKWSKWMSPCFLATSFFFPFNIQTKIRLSLKLPHITAFVFRRTSQGTFLQTLFIVINFLRIFHFFLPIMNFIIWVLILTVKCSLTFSLQSKNVQIKLNITALNSVWNSVIALNLNLINEWMHEQTLNCSWGTGVISEDWLKQGLWFMLIFDAFSTTGCII